MTNVQANARVVSVAAYRQSAQRRIAAAFQVAAVLGLHFTFGRATAFANGIKICLLVQKASV